MKKSSLGRRSSTHIPVRVPSLGGSASSSKRFSGDKRTGSSLKQPGFASQGQFRRSQSEDRESYGGRSTMVRSNTAGALPARGLGAMTPVTPRQSDFNNHLPTGSARPSRAQTSSTGGDSNRRMSSFGGKNSRKDSRPLSEKSFQQAAQLKVQQYFNSYGTDIVGPGNSIRPMNTKLFVDMMDHLLKNLDNRIVITKSNYLEELPTLLRKLGYRSKVDRSWLMTVNTPHSWQHVIGVLSWLVDMFECLNCVNPFEMMYGNDLGESVDDDDELYEDSIKIDKQFIEYVKKTHRLSCDPAYDEDAFEQLDMGFIEKQIVEAKCTDEDFEILQRQIDLVKTEYEEEMKTMTLHQEALEILQQKFNASKSDLQESEAYIENSNRYVENTELKIANLEQEIEVKRVILNKKKEELQKLQAKVASQEISVDDKDNIIKEKQDLQRKIHVYDSQVREFEKSAFAVDLKIAEDQRKLDKVIVDYNIMLAENVVVEPRLKDVGVNLTILNNEDDQELKKVDENFEKIKEDVKHSLHALELKKNELEKVLFQLKQDQKLTEEEIAKETALLEGVECDLEKQEELINKESQKFKEERSRYEKMTKEIKDELSQFDPAKLEEKKIEMEKVKHDWEVIQKRAKLLMKEKMKITQEGIEKVIVAAEKLNKVAEEFHKKNQII